MKKGDHVYLKLPNRTVHLKLVTVTRTKNVRYQPRKRHKQRKLVLSDNDLIESIINGADQ